MATKQLPLTRIAPRPLQQKVQRLVVGSELEDGARCLQKLRYYLLCGLELRLIWRLAQPPTQYLQLSRKSCVMQRPRMS
jgi:hypothetical protein